MSATNSTETGQHQSALLEAMMRQVRDLNGPLMPSIDQGYTYLAQFLTHELAAPSRSNGPAARSVFGPMNLDSLYGPSPHIDFLFEASGRFQLNQEFGVVDLPRQEATSANPAEAKIPEPRNDENVIVAQLHLLLMKLHNYLIDNAYAGDVAEARALVTRLFQLIVVEDLLYQVLSPSVFAAVFRNGSRELLASSDQDLQEAFSNAAFRFGHSMIRHDYFLTAADIDAQQPRKLSTLFRKGKPLRTVDVVEWPLFFGWPSSPLAPPTANASMVDQHIDRQMTELSGPSHDEPNIIVSDLAAGARVQPFLGVDYLRERVTDVAHSMIDFQPFTDADMPGSFVDRELGKDDLPLWVYILFEARHHTTRLEQGKILGPLGSLIIAEFVFRSLKSSSDSPISVDHGYDFSRAFSELGALGQALRDVPDAQDLNGNQKLSFRQVIQLIGAN